MTDVRLTATNPEDSSVVPVACNSKGELLVTEPVIEAIDNDVVLNGALTVTKGLGGFVPKGSNYLVCGDDGDPVGTLYYARNKLGLHINAGGMVGPDDKWLAFDHSTMPGAVQIAMAADNGSIVFCTQIDKQTGDSFQIPIRFVINEDGPASYRYTLKADPARSDQRTIEVREELEFLRAQVRALMERLKMVPEGGWEVWDGSAETRES